MKNTEKVIFEGYPKRMMVWDDGTGRRNELCYVVVNDKFPYKTLREDNCEMASWQHARYIAPEKPRTIEDGLVQGDVIVDPSGKKVKRLKLGNFRRSNFYIIFKRFDRSMQCSCNKSKSY